MNCFPLVTNDSFEGEVVVWARRRLRKRGRSRAKFQMWYQIWTAEADFTLSFSPQKITWLIWKIHVQILQTIRPLGSLHGNQAIVCHCLSFGAMVFPPHCLREMSTVSFFFFFSFLPVFSALPALFPLFLFPHTGAEILLWYSGANSRTKECGENCLCNKNIRSFLSSLNILRSPLRTQEKLSGEGQVSTTRQSRRDLL